MQGSDNDLAKTLILQHEALAARFPGVDDMGWVEDGSIEREFSPVGLPGGVQPVVAKRGEIWRVRLLSGRERDVYVFSTEKVNQDGLARVVPILPLPVEHDQGFAVSLRGAGTQTQGAILSHLIRTLDFSSPERHAVRIESAPAGVFPAVAERIRLLLGLEPPHARTSGDNA